MINIKKQFGLLISLCLSICAYAHIDERPKIALVLSGGGAKGGAHVGALKVIDSLNIPIDYVVGTSMGAVVGGLYASGYSGDAIERIITSIDWSLVLRNEVDRNQIYYRRKRDDDLFLVSKFIGFKDGKLHFPKGIVQGHELYQTFKKFTIAQEPFGSFDQLPIPYRAIATNLITGEKVTLSNGDLAKAMLASMSVPGLFAPVEYGDALLVDGGVVNNIPIETAKALGADVLIVVDVGSPMLTKEQITSFEDVLTQLTNLYVQNNTAVSKAMLSHRDIMIVPSMGEVDTPDYDKINLAILAGVQAAQAATGELSRHSSAQTKQRSAPKDSFYLKNLSVLNDSALCLKTFDAYLPITPGLYDAQTIDSYISRLYGLEMFETIDFNVENETLVVAPQERQWGPTFVQSLLSISTDFDGNSNFIFGLALTRTMMNALAGELRAYGSIGDRAGVFLEWYQPFTTDLAWYINPRISYNRKPVGFFVNDEEILRYLLSSVSGSFAIGRNFREWGRAEMGYIKEDGSTRIMIGSPVLPESNFNTGSSYIQFQWDTLDNSFFPHDGTIGLVQYQWYRKGLGSDQNFDQLSTRGISARSIGKHTGLLAARYETTTSGISQLNTLFSVGGLFRLSGLTQDQLIGQQAALLSAIYYYQFTDIKAIPNYPFPIYLGASMETGNAWETNTALFKHSFKGAGSLFVGLDTIVGPFYLGYGFAENGKRAIHLYMGRPF